jgi:uncharacterized FlgJ-related protein
VDAASDMLGQAEANWLLIFGNADRPDILQDYLPLSGTQYMLVTSRDPLSKTSPSISSVVVDLEPFGDEEAAAFLRQLSHKNREEDVSLKLRRNLVASRSQHSKWQQLSAINISHFMTSLKNMRTSQTAKNSMDWKPEFRAKKPAVTSLLSGP